MDKKMYKGMEEDDSYLKKGMKDEDEKVHKLAMMKAAMKSANRKRSEGPMSKPTAGPMSKPTAGPKSKPTAGPKSKPNVGPIMSSLTKAKKSY